MFDLFKKQVKKTEKYSHADYNVIFENKEVDGMAIEEINIGELNLPTGKIIVCDPLVFPDVVPLVKTVAPGKYPVKIYVAKTEDSGDRFAIAKLEFSTVKASKWILALREDQCLSELKEPSDYYGFPVDAGLGGFLDYRTGLEYEKFIKKHLVNNPDWNHYDDFFAVEFKKNARDPDDLGDWLNYTFPNTELNITMFHSGYGDGVYPAYWGMTDANEIVSLVIDFFVVLLPEDEQ